MNNPDELEIGHVMKLNPAFFAVISAAVRNEARSIGFDDVVIRKRSDGATALVAVKRREVMQ